jgi:aminopeptidase N
LQSFTDTATVYQKGAEIIGIYKTLLGEEGFKKGLKLYFDRHDGTAVTCDDFRRAMAGKFVQSINFRL